MRKSVHRIAILGSVAMLLLQRLLAAEQSRWAGFNAQIEELERAAAAAPR